MSIYHSFLQCFCYKNDFSPYFYYTIFFYFFYRWAQTNMIFSYLHKFKQKKFTVLSLQNKTIAYNLGQK